MAEPMDQIGKLEYRLSAKPSFLEVQYAGTVDSVETARAWIVCIDAALKAHRLDRVLWDSRLAEPLPSDVRAHIWGWLGEGTVLLASAIVVDSSMLRVSANLSAIGGGPKIRAFGEMKEATAWLEALELGDEAASGGG